ncbi:Leucine-rich repeat [Sesbania bispinosa]|nr:Leucine-rich repeat [Sesbania bispinosa]
MRSQGLTLSHTPASGVTCDNEGRVIGLDLSEESIFGGLENSTSLFSLQHLQKLNLADNDFNFVIPPSGFSKLLKLTYLNLSFARFGGQIPIEISHLTRLVTLDLSNNYDFSTGGGLKLENPNLSIRQLYLEDVSITAEGQEWCNALLPLRDLQELSMSQCGLSGPLDSSLTRLKNLSLIILDENDFSSPVPETFANFKNLTTLRLASCGLTGRFPQKIFQIETLSVIDISYNYNLHGFFQDFPLNGSLQTIRVSNTSFSGALPHSIGYLTHLSELDLSFCQFNGTLPNSLSNLTKLSNLDLSHNSLTGPMPSFGMANKLTHLDLSHNALSGSIPSSLFTLPLLQRIDLSHNQFSQLDEIVNVSSSALVILHLNSNNLSGPFPESIFHLTALSHLDLSSNKFHGFVQLNKLLKLRNLTTLDLSHNNLSFDENVRDVDSPSFPNIRNLILVSCNLKTFPGFLRNISTTLRNLDLSNNQIQGIVPNWIWRLETLFELNISNNLLTDLEGPMQNLTSTLVTLDLHKNQIQSGKLPDKYFRTWKKMMHDEDQVVSEFIHEVTTGSSYYQDSVTVVNKGLQMDLVKILTVFTSIDFSSNYFEGPIPREIMNFKALHVLNLSNNALSGEIPPSIGNLKQLESLDLSHNSLGGEIPVQLASLTFLSYLNLSFNHLVGKIPTGTQLQLCPASSFEGNDGLYGPPLDDEKPDTKNQGLSPQQACRRLACSIDWNFISAEVGFVSGLGIFIGPLLFLKQWRVWYWQLVNKILCFIFPQLYLEYVTRRGQTYTVLRWWY